MLLYKRPRRPNGLKSKTNEKLQELGTPGSSENWPEFDDAFWGGLKKYFMKAQYKKCGYCEVRLSDFGDVEHYRPKSEIQELVAEGGELDHLRNVRGRKNPAITERGYWWLAYEWDNYLVSCSLCNRSYKSALFPVATQRLPREHPKFKAIDPQREHVATEGPLLINPFEKGIDVYDHFEYNDIGMIKPRNNSPRGLETIRVCGLHRMSLIEQRLEKVESTHELCNDLMTAGDDRRLLASSAVNLYISGHETSHFAGMVRIVFRDRTGLKWNELEALIKKEGWMARVEERLAKLHRVWGL